MAKFSRVKIQLDENTENSIISSRIATPTEDFAQKKEKIVGRPISPGKPGYNHQIKAIREFDRKNRCIVLSDEMTHRPQKE